MANTRSAEKMIRVAERRRLRNRSVKSAVKTYIRKAERGIVAAADDFSALVVQAISSLDKAASKGILHPRTPPAASRRLMKKLNLAASRQLTARPASTSKSPTNRSGSLLCTVGYRVAGAEPLAQPTRALSPRRRPTGAGPVGRASPNVCTTASRGRARSSSTMKIRCHWPSASRPSRIGIVWLPPSIKLEAVGVAVRALVRRHVDGPDVEVIVTIRVLRGAPSGRETRPYPQGGAAQAR